MTPPPYLVFCAGPGGILFGKICGNDREAYAEILQTHAMYAGEGREVLVLTRRPDGLYELLEAEVGVQLQSRARPLAFSHDPHR